MQWIHFQEYVDVRWRSSIQTPCHESLHLYFNITHVGKLPALKSSTHCRTSLRLERSTVLVQTLESQFDPSSATYKQIWPYV